MRSVAFYGKGGSGKTTVAASLARLLAKDGQRVLLLGCDPKHDTSYALVPHGSRTTVLDQLRRLGAQDPTPADFVMRGESGIDCVEAGGPEPGVGCAGRGITLMLDLLGRQGVLEERYDWILFDVLGDVVCGGFAAPIRAGYAREVCAVVSGEVLSLYAANNICRALVRYRETGVRLAGLLPNLRGVPREEEILQQFAARVSAPLLPAVPRDPAVHEAHLRGHLVVDDSPRAPASQALLALAGQLNGSPAGITPQPLDDAAFEGFVQSHIAAEPRPPARPRPRTAKARRR